VTDSDKQNFQELISLEFYVHFQHKWNFQEFT